MAKLVFLSLLALCCVTFISCKSSSSSSSNPPAADPKGFVQDTCGQLIMPKVCTADLTPFASEIQGDMKRLVLKAASISKDKVKSSTKLLTKLQHGKNTTADRAKVVESCLSNYKLCGQQVTMAEGSLKTIAKTKSDDTYTLRASVNTWLEDSATNASACASNMNGVKTDAFPGADAYNLLDGTSNTMMYFQAAVSMYFQALISPPASTAWTPLPSTIDADP